MSNMFSSDASLRVFGFDAEERWRSPEEFLAVYQRQMDEIPDFRVDVREAEAFEDGAFGWMTVHSTMVTPESATPMRHSAVFRLEAGSWRVVQWHNSIPVSNRQIFGVSLTTSLDVLVASVLGDRADLTEAAGSEGTMTLVFTDIVDSTILAESVGDVAWAALVASHESAVRRITTSHGGTVVKLLGDGSMLAFGSARSAMRAAVDLQRACSGERFEVRIGIHTGEVIRTSDDLFGLTVNKAARVAMAADPGGIMVSSTTQDLAGSLAGIRVGEPRIIALKGFSDKHQVFPIEWD